MKHKFLTNHTDLTFLNKIKESLLHCDSFYFSVSFIKKAGLVLLANDIKAALERGVRGKIITSTYQNFTDIGSLNDFLTLMYRYNNFEVHLDMNSFGFNGFHTKGYLFSFKDHFEVVIGSNNITRFALLKNIEWSVSIYTSNRDNLIDSVMNEFNDLWSKTYELNNEIISKYGLMLNYAIEKWDMDYIDSFDSVVKPNYMQRKALKEIRSYRDRGVNKALVIAATGSGKTYLAAFDARNFEAKRLLFVVHRDTILKEAIKTFNIVFGSKNSYGLFTGSNKDLDSDFIFSTNHSMAKNLGLFDKNEFDYFVLDEVHHAVAGTYKKIIEYFKPEFLLGLTATPERMDNQNIFELFEYNVPYELRLRDALINDLIVPFKYYGIKDDLLDYEDEDPKKIIRQISDNLHIEFIHEQIQKYRKLEKLKAIGFCRSIEHARVMAEKLGGIGYNTTYLSGKNDTGERLSAFNELQADDKALEIIFAVDLLNEGVDIPAINMILFLRPTESSTIFIQQLGRGLRKYPNKEYLTVLDFIGNSYARSVQIALALGTLSKNISVDKRLLANYVREDFKQLDIPIEIHIDELSKEEIINSIEKTNFNSILFLKQDYLTFKKYLGETSYLKHIDFLNSDISGDLLRYIKKHGSLYNFLDLIREDIPIIDDYQRSFLKYLSSMLPLIRPYEFMIIRELINKGKSYDELESAISKYEYYNKERFDHALNNLQNQFYSDKERLKMKSFIEINSDKYQLLVIVNDIFSELLVDLLDYGISRFESEFYGVTTPLKRYYTYTRGTLLQALCNHTFASREGLIWNNGILYIFIDLKKDLDKDEWLLFDDKFISKDILQWESSTNTTINNSAGQRIINQEKIHVFVRKVKQEDGITQSYTYLGAGSPTNPRASNNIKKSLLFDIILDNEVPDYLKYDFEVPEDEENN